MQSDAKFLLHEKVSSGRSEVRGQRLEQSVPAPCRAVVLDVVEELLTAQPLHVTKNTLWQAVHAVSLPF